MKPFLEIVAGDLYSNYGDTISSLTLVFPNQRASLFFNRYLSHFITKPIWLPQTTTMSNLMFSYAKVKPADPLLLNYKLYKTFVKTTQNPEPYDDFYFWGNIMLADFDQVDKYLVDPQKLFTNINDIKVIEQTFNEFDDESLNIIKNFLNIVSPESGSEIRSRYSKIWGKLHDIYNSFTRTLITEGIAYEGLAYRLAVQSLSAHEVNDDSKKYVFIGFNALSKSERKLLLHLRDKGKAIFYWDYDSYYINSSTGVEHEAGVFMRQNLKDFPNSLAPEIFNNINSKDKNKPITLISSPSEVTQAKIVPEILKKLNVSPDELTTAVVLPDEKLLLPLLTALPEEYSDANITMEYPLRETSAYSFVDALITLQKSTDKQDRFYYRDVLQILLHPYIQLVCPSEAEEIRKTIIDQQLLKVPMEVFSNSQTLKQVFKHAEKGSELASYVSACITVIVNRLVGKIVTNDDKLKLELEYLLAINQSIKRLSSVISQIEVEYSIKTFRSYFTKALAEQRISFIGQPLSGIQIMGFLETRNLDFKNLIILSVNDSLLPGASFTPSFITPSLRMAYGLPDYRHQNAIYAYYFYRLIQRAENIYLIYTNKTEGVKSGELSRFVQQLQVESNIPIRQIALNFELGTSIEKPIVITKNDFIKNKLNKYLETTEEGRYLSPSALSEYKNCPLSFFFNRVLSISPPDELEEELDAMGIGSVFHKAMEEIYSAYVGKVVNNEQIQNWLSTNGFIDETVFNTFKAINHYKGSIEELNGRNRLLIERVIWMVRNALRTDQGRTPYKLIALEKEVVITLPITFNNQTVNVRLGGKIDRLEEKDGKTIIVDFKTGNPDNSKIKISEIDDLKGKTDKDGIFQLLVYKYIYTLINNTDKAKVDVLLWYVRNNQLPTTNIPDHEEFWSSFVEYLKKLIAEIIITDTSFTQTNNLNQCKNCNYATICNR